MEAAELDLCGRCLVIVDARTVIRARHPDGCIEVCEHSTDPRTLKKWVEARAYGDGCTFQVDNTTDRFLAISTWHGDPVCSWHLWVLAEAEMRDGYRARALCPR